jgi:hypothetical protein
MRRIFDYLILSLIVAILFIYYGYIFTAGGMICLYATFYALAEEGNPGSPK